RVGLIRGASVLSADPWHFYQDTFPFNESVAPSGVDFDTTTALMVSSLNVVSPNNPNGRIGEGVVQGDSIIFQSLYEGTSATGTRLDLVFRIDPGPGNYTIRGNRGSGLIEKDPSHPFWATYLGNNGPYGTPGGHGGTWNPNVWNSARMD